MKGEVVLLVAGLTIAATLPIQEQLSSSTQTELLNIILSANPTENDLHISDERLFVSPTQIESLALLTELSQPEDPPQEQSQPEDPPQDQSQPEDPPQDQSQPEDPPQEQSQPEDPPQDQPQPDDPPQEQSQPDDPPQDQPQPEDPPQDQPQPEDPPQEQSQPDDPEADTPDTAPEQLHPQGSPHSREQDILPEPQDPNGESSSQDLNLNSERIRWEPHPIRVYGPGEDFPSELEKSQRGEFNSNFQVDTFSDTSDDGYVALSTNNEQFSLNVDGVGMHDLNMETVNEEEQFLFDPKEEETKYFDYFPHDFNKEALSFDSMTDSYPLNNEETPTRFTRTHAEEDSFVDNSELNTRPQIHSFPLGEEHIDSDYEESPYDIKEEPFKADFYGFPMEEEQPEYDYEYPIEEDESQWKDDILSLHEDGPDEEESYPESDDSAIDFIKWLVPDFLYEDHINYDDPSYATSYHDDAGADQESFVSEPDTQTESQTLIDQTTYSQEYTNEPSDEIINFDESFPENENTVMGETMEPTSHELTDRPTDDVSLADYYISVNEGPVYDDIPREYFEDDTLQDEDIISHEEEEEENFSTDDGLYTDPPQRIYYGDIEKNKPYTKTLNNDILFDNPLFEDEMSDIQNTADEDSEYQYKYMGEDNPTPIIIETQPTDVTYFDTKVMYPSLLKMLRKEIVGKQLIDPQNGAKSLLMDAITHSDPDKDIKELSMQSEYLSNHIDNDDTMNVMVFKNSKNLFDDDMVIDEDQVPTINRYTKDRNTEPYWLPQRTHQRQFPKIYFSTTDELMRRQIPELFGRTSEALPFWSPSSFQSLKRSVMDNPSTLMNEIMDDDLPSQPFPSTKTQTSFRFNDRDTPRSSGNHDAFTTPKLSFRDMLQRLNPSFPDDAYVNNYPSYYPQSYMLGYSNFHPSSYMSSSLPYSASYQSFDERSYSPVQIRYYNTKPLVMSSFSSIIEPSNLFQDDTMPQMEYQHPMRRIDDNTDEHQFGLKDSFSTPRLPFHFYPELQYLSNYPSYRRPRYLHNNFYDMEPRTTRMYQRYPFEYY